MKVKVRDFFGAEAIAEASVRVVIGHPGNRPPAARLVAIPNPVETAAGVTYDASASSDPDGDVLRYCWDANGDDRVAPNVCTNDDPVCGPLAGFAAPGAYPIHLSVADSSGAADEARDHAHGRFRQRGQPAADGALTVTPISPEVATPAILDASAPSDPEGPLARYEWDLDVNGSFETDNGDDSVLEASFDAPGERFVRLRITDAAGATDTAGRTVNVRRPEDLALARGALALTAKLPARRTPGRPRARALAFSARVTSAPPGDRGERRRRGRRLSLLGAVGRGPLRTRLLTPPGRASRPERRLRGFLSAPWRTQVGFRCDRRSKRLIVKTIALARARRPRGSQACVRIRVTARPGRQPTGSFKLFGGRRAGARLHGAGRFRFRIERNGSATVLGHLRARGGRKRPLTRGCRAFAELKPRRRMGSTIRATEPRRQ